MACTDLKIDIKINPKSLYTLNKSMVQITNSFNFNKFIKKENKMGFKVGDTVRCIDASKHYGNGDGGLVLNRIYTISRISLYQNELCLEELPGISWKYHRFIKFNDYLGKGISHFYYESNGLSKIKSSDFKNIWISEIKETNEYKFRGEINIDHLINDCIKDQKICFLAISKTHGIVGISKQVSIKDKFEFCNQLTNAHEDEIQKAFYIIHINKSDIGIAVKELTRLSKLVKNRLRNIAKKLKKNSKAGKYSNEPETKVRVF